MEAERQRESERVSERQTGEPGSSFETTQLKRDHYNSGYISIYAPKACFNLKHLT